MTGKGMKPSMALSTKIIENVWEKLKPDELRKIRRGSKKRILVVRGSYDTIEDILKEAKVPHTLLEEFPDKEDLRQRGKYCTSKVMFVNCDETYHDDYDGDFEAKNLGSHNRQALRNFVSQGGRLITTDWAQGVVRYLFGKIQADEDVTGDELVRVNFANDIAREMSGIFYGNASPNWWLEGSSDLISYRKNSGVVSLVESDDLEERYGSRSIAVGFPYKQGEVFHFVSHLIAQKVKNYEDKEKACLATFLDKGKFGLRELKNARLKFGPIETAYTLMNTVLELSRNGNILPREGGKKK